MSQIIATSHRNSNQKRTNQGQGKPANVSPRCQQHEYEIDDMVELVGRVARPASMRRAIEGVNVPAQGKTWQDLANWRARYGLPPVIR